ncbi:DUF1223 domain-containing protein [Persicitalea sp.]|uniref:DUF1223 domain-containing protein n=1 Tax=Persicitalea sp. TaxID=3100273 RepID=UPI003594850E
MKSVLFLFAIGTAWWAIGQKEVVPVADKSFEPVVVLELFTSQGCSSCPAADRLLTQTIQKSYEPKILALSFHVDYWNHLGWADPFSDKAYTKRQYAYAKKFNSRSVYTPQMVVNGTAQFVGSNEAALKKALSNATRQASSANFDGLSVKPASGNVLKVQYQLAGDYQNCKVNFALVSKRENTAIKRGENGGRTLSSDNVVRQFITVPAIASGEVLFNDRAGRPDDLSVIAYVQRAADLRIVGGAKVEVK